MADCDLGHSPALPGMPSYLLNCLCMISAFSASIAKPKFTSVNLIIRELRLAADSEAAIYPAIKLVFPFMLNKSLFDSKNW